MIEKKLKKNQSVNYFYNYRTMVDSKMSQLGSIKKLILKIYYNYNKIWFNILLFPLVLFIEALFQMIINQESYSGCIIKG